MLVSVRRTREAGTMHVFGVESNGAHEVKLCECVSGQGEFQGNCRLLVKRDHCWYFMYKNSFPFLGL